MPISRNNKNPPAAPLTETEWKQPELCISCIWGRLEGTKQFCSLPRCVVEDKGMKGASA
ncbi:hypothetical protein [Paenibacillus aceti]|uniref:Uncharacterized protein n=1 Tax=Paenibacillus aceti TaxID=1820010 RepID=A0ABQ1W475_9BACL|nr:hypothetical protein [Paenibacillus aceti]GGG13483.1 hypothetical protein GCM10010913_39080 [Paenibacillus aceti]